MTLITFSSPLFVTIKLFKIRKLKYAEMIGKILNIFSSNQYEDIEDIFIL